MKKFLSLFGSTSSKTRTPQRESQPTIQSTKLTIAMLPEIQFSSWDLLSRLNECHPVSPAQHPPHDILHEIFMFLSNSSGRRSLLSCALVCRSWNNSCSPILLRVIRIPLLLCPHPEFAAAMVYHGSSTRRSILRCFLNLLLESPRISAYLVHLELEGSVEFSLFRTVLEQLRGLRVLHLNPVMFECLDERPYTSPPTRGSLDTLVLSHPIAETPPTWVRPVCIDVIPWFNTIQDLRIYHCEDRNHAIVHMANNYKGEPVSVKKIAVSGKSLQHLKPLAKSVLKLHAIDSLEALRLEFSDSQEFIRTVTESCTNAKSCSVDLVCNRCLYPTDHAFMLELNTVLRTLQTVPITVFAFCTNLRAFTMTARLYSNRFHASLNPLLASLCDHYLSRLVIAPSVLSLTLHLELQDYSRFIDNENGGKTFTAFLSTFKWETLDDYFNGPEWEMKELRILVSVLGMASGGASNRLPGPTQADLGFARYIKAKVSLRTFERITFD